MMMEKPQTVLDIEKFVVNNDKLKPRFIFSDSSFLAGELISFSTLSDIEPRKVGSTRLDDSTKGVLLFEYSDGFGVKTNYQQVRNSFEKIEAEGLITKAFLKYEGTWGYKDFISRQNELQLVFSRCNPFDFFDDLFIDGEDK